MYKEQKEQKEKTITTLNQELVCLDTNSSGYKEIDEQSNKEADNDVESKVFVSFNFIYLSTSYLMKTGKTAQTGV